MNTPTTSPRNRRIAAAMLTGCVLTTLSGTIATAAPLLTTLADHAGVPAVQDPGAPAPLPDWYTSNNIDIETENCHAPYTVDVNHVRLECQVSSGSSIVATTPGTGVDGLNLKVDVVRPLQGGTNAHIETFHKDGLQIISRQHGDITQADPSATFDFDRHHNLPYNYEYVGTKMVINTPLFSKGGNVALIVHR